LQSGIFIPGNGKALVKLRGVSGKYLLAASQNKGPLKVFQLRTSCKTISLNPLDISAIISYKDSRHQKREFEYGSSFLSQSGRFLNIDNNVTSIEIKNNRGEIRKVNME